MTIQTQTRPIDGQTTHYDLPDARGHFGAYGGSFVS